MLHSFSRRSTLVVAAAFTLGSVGTLASVANVTHYPAPSLVQAVLTSTDLPPVGHPVPFVAGHFYMGSQAVGESAVWLLPTDLTGFDLPAFAAIRVRTASGEIQTCSHGKGSGVTADGVPVSGDGWSCSRLTPPKFAVRAKPADPTP